MRIIASVNLCGELGTGVVHIWKVKTRRRAGFDSFRITGEGATAPVKHLTHQIWQVVHPSHDQEGSGAASGCVIGITCSTSIGQAYSLSTAGRTKNQTAAIPTPTTTVKPSLLILSLLFPSKPARSVPPTTLNSRKKERTTVLHQQAITQTPGSFLARGTKMPGDRLMRP